MSSGASATRSKKQAKGPRYAKDAAVGDWVHIKGIHVTSQAELKRIFGTKGLLVINFEERNDDDDALSAIVNSQLTDDSALSTVLLPPQSVTRPSVTQPSIAGTTDTSDSSTAALDKPVVKNGLDWFPVKEIVDADINGRIPAIKWCFLGNDDNYMQPDDDDGTKRSILDYFLSVMPQETIRRVLQETNEKLSTQGKDVLLYPELIRFFGVCILITQFEFET
jgi:hypothetical protein